MKSIFVSYCTTDSKVAKKIANRLESYYDVFIDFSGIAGGTVWESQIETSIRNSDAFILLVSPESNRSEWVIRETLYAEHLNKIRIPVLLSGDMPFRIIHLQYVDFRADFDAGLSDLLEAISQHAQPRLRNEHDADLLIAASVRNRLAGNILQSDKIMKQAVMIDNTLWKSEDDIWAHLAVHIKQIPVSKLNSLSVVETAKQLDEKIYDDRRAYEWSVSLAGDGNVLDTIDHVKYRLHPTFTPQSQVVRSRGNGFRLSQIGWGTFKILITIHLKDGQSMEIPYYLTFNYENRVPIKILEMN